MPELPEVERARRLAASVADDRVIKQVTCARDTIVFDSVTPRTMQRSLVGRRVLAVRRKGKQLWFELDDQPMPLFHLGMAGAIRTPMATPLRLVSHGQRAMETDWPPRWMKILIKFDDGGELAMTDQRRFGRIRLRKDPPAEPPISELGFDPLLDLPPRHEFRDLLFARRGNIKGVLLDQSFAAGVGNWIADEVLYQAGIDPRRRVGDLSETEAGRIRAALKRIIETAVRVNAEKPRFPKTWLFHHRWGRNAEAITARGERIEHLKIAGRTTAWVPTAQS